MEIKGFEQALPEIMYEIGIDEDGINDLLMIHQKAVVVRVPDEFAFKSFLLDKVKKHGVNVIYVDCRIETPLIAMTRMNQAGWGATFLSSDVKHAESTKTDKLSSILLIDHLSDFNDERVLIAIANILKANMDSNICGMMNIPVIATFSKKENMDYFYQSDFNIFDERYWK